MTKSFTQNDLVRYLYQEMCEAESDHLIKAMHADESLMEAYIELCGALDEIDHFLIEPSEKVVNAIKALSITGLEKV